MGVGENYCIVCAELTKNEDLAPNGACDVCCEKYHKALEFVNLYEEQTK
jgi:hypothetical protein